MLPQEIVKRLSAFSHRGTGTLFEKQVLDFLVSLFDNQQVSLELFHTPKTYISVVWWLIGGLCTGLWLLNFIPLLGLLLVIGFVVLAFLYLNWYPSMVTKFPPQVKSSNVVVSSKVSVPSSKKLILMAHYDTAPISFLYRPEQVGNFRKSLIISLLLMLIAIVFAVFVVAKIWIFSLWIANGLIAYFLVQGITSTVDFFRLGYSNGASDNATGVAAAIETAKRLWQNPPNDLAVELVLTGAEEMGMMGARAYFLKNQQSFHKQTYLLNFDTLGAGDLKVITQTGSLISIHYDNPLTQVAQEIILKSPELQGVSTGSWHTADFDSVWFQRIGMPCLTLAALDQNGQMPRIHRPEDTLDKIDFRPMEQAIDLAEKIARGIASTKKW